MFQIMLGNNVQKEKGFIFLEVLIASTLIIVVFVTLLGIGFTAVNISNSIQKSHVDDALLKEAFEALRTYRDGSTWALGMGTVSYGSSNKYHMAVSSGSWSLASGEETVGIYTRYIYFDRVSRDPTTQDIESSYNATHLDANTLKATVVVSWPEKTYLVSEYITNWQE